MDEKLQIKILEQKIRDLKNKLFEKDFVGLHASSHEYQVSFFNEFLEIYKIDGGGNGWIIRFQENGSCQLFEIGGTAETERFSGEFQNVYDALKIANSWT